MRESEGSPVTECSPYPWTGFKLAFNYLKDKKFVDAIEVCHSVSQEHGLEGAVASPLPDFTHLIYLYTRS